MTYKTLDEVDAIVLNATRVYLGSVMVIQGNWYMDRQKVREEGAYQVSLAIDETSILEYDHKTFTCRTKYDGKSYFVRTV